MVIVADPDDIEFGCAGTTARWVKNGAEVCYVLCTSGEVGIAKPGMTKAKAAEIREAEQLAAAAVVEVSEVLFLHEPDGMLENTMALRKRLVREIRRFKPEAVITMDPTIYWVSDEYINHPVNRAAGGAAIEAIFPVASRRNLFEELAEEGLTAHEVRKVYVRNFGQDGRNTCVDISDTIDLKIEALKKHVSQIGDWDPKLKIREWAAGTGEQAGVAYGESYRVITLVNNEEKIISPFE